MGPSTPTELPQGARDTVGAQSQSWKLSIWGLVSWFTVDLQGDLEKVT